MRIEVDQTIPRSESYSAARARSLYNVTDGQDSRFQLTADLPVEGDDWQIGVVVGPSGTGKSSIGRQLTQHGWKEWDFSWPHDTPILEAVGGDFAKATSALSAVGLGSVPSWLRPWHVLSTGEAFRADMAALLLSGESDVFLDEFTSVLDRQVAQVGAAAFAKSWRRVGGRKVILLSCHYDILDWLLPDWVFDTGDGKTFVKDPDASPDPEVGRLVIK